MLKQNNDAYPTTNVSLFIPKCLIASTAYYKHKSKYCDY